MKYQLWATAKDGDGHVISLGIYDDPTDIEIRVGMWSDDIVITIEEVTEDENKR